MQAKKFIDMLEQQGLLDAEILTELRRQLAEAKTNVRPETVAKLLVENGQLTRFQASKLIASMQEGNEDLRPMQPASEELDLAAEEQASDSGVLEVLDSEPSAEVEIVEEFVDTAEVLEEVPVAAMETGIAPRSNRESQSSTNVPTEAKAAKKKKGKPEYSKPKKRSKVVTKTGKSEWDSFRIYGFFGILCCLLVFLGFFGLWFWRGDETKWIAECDSLYKNRDYDNAINRYKSFLSRFPNSDEASRATVRIVLSEILVKSEQSGEPEEASKLAGEKLRSVVSEPAMETERSDMAAALMLIAEKFNQRAERAKTLDEKKAFLEKLGQHFLLIENPSYFGSQEKKRNEARLNRIKEERDRIQRDIQRTDDLNEAIDKMQVAIKENDVLKAYSLRRDLVKKYVQLESDSKLLELVGQATALQQGLVAAPKQLPKINRDAPVVNRDNLAVTLASNRTPGGGTNVRGMIAIWAKSAVYGLSATDGKVLWRRYMGLQSSIEPLRLSNDLESDVLMVYPEQGILQRLSAVDGSQKWEVAFGGPVREPVIDREEIFVTTAAGGVFCLDAEGGENKWGKQIPQGIEVGPGVVSGRNILYVLGDHSNLFVMDRKTGECSEVYYLGHQAGSIRVPPVVTMGHILVFENAGPGFSFMRMLRPKEDGKGVAVGQDPIRLEGHVVFKPTPEGRRLSVTTDLREIAVFDIEPSKDRDQVSRIAHRVANEKSPKDIWSLVDKNELWVASENLTRFEILVAKQQLEGKWIKEDQDRFTGRPQRMDRWVVSSRMLRGTMGVRVAAIDGVSGESAWETDLGVPVAFVEAKDSTLPIYAVSSQAALMAIEKGALEGGPAPGLLENAGRGERMLNFQSPVKLADGRTVLFNVSGGSQITISDITSSTAAGKLRRIAMAIGNAVPSAQPAAVGNLLAVPLNNGQLMLIDPGSGQMKAQPFQPALQPGGVHEWVGPAVLSDQQTVVISDSTQRLYRIGTNGPLRSLGEKVLERALRGNMVALQDTVIGVSRGPAGDFIDSFRGGDLEPLQSVALEGRVIWGPFVAGDRAYIQSDSEGLVAIGGDGKLIWKCELPRMVVVGAPQLIGQDLLLSGAVGFVARISSTGKEVGRTALGEPLNGTPIIMGDNIIVPGYEGAALIGKIPSANGATP